MYRVQKLEMHTIVNKMILGGIPAQEIIGGKFISSEKFVDL